MNSICPWALGDPLLRGYHDTEWGVPCHDDTMLFELLCLEGAQAGLSWLTILKRREGYRKAFRNFSIPACAALTDDELEEIRLHGDLLCHCSKPAAAGQQKRQNDFFVHQFQSLYPFLAPRFGQ